MRKPKGYWRDWKNVVTELEPIMDKNHGLIPSGKNDIAKFPSLALAISKYHGGMRAVRERLFVTAWVNKAKSNLPMDQFIAFCEAVVTAKGGQNGRVL